MVIFCWSDNNSRDVDIIAVIVDYDWLLLVLVLQAIRIIDILLLQTCIIRVVVYTLNGKIKTYGTQLFCTNYQNGFEQKWFFSGLQICAYCFL